MMTGSSSATMGYVSIKTSSAMIMMIVSMTATKITALLRQVCFILLCLHVAGCKYRDYCMVGGCVRFLCTSCERLQNERVSAANE